MYCFILFCLLLEDQGSGRDNGYLGLFTYIYSVTCWKNGHSCLIEKSEVTKTCIPSNILSVLLQVE